MFPEGYQPGSGDLVMVIKHTLRPWWSRWLLGRVKTTVEVKAR